MADSIREKIRARIEAQQAAAQASAKPPAGAPSPKPAKHPPEPSKPSRVAEKPAAADAQSKAAAKPRKTKGTGRTGRPRLKDGADEATQKRRAEHREAIAKRKRDVDKIAVDAYKRAQKTAQTISEAPPSRPDTFAPSVQQRAQVETLAALGLPVDQIRAIIINPATGYPVNLATLKKAFQIELDQGVAKGNAKIAEGLYNRAIGMSYGPKDRPKYLPPDPTAGIFLAKVRLGWRADVTVQVESRSGVLVPPPRVSVADWLGQVAQANDESSEPTE